MAIKAADSTGLIPRISQYDYFRADATKSPGRVLLGGLAYYLVAKTDRIEVRINKPTTLGSVVSIWARGAKGQQALNILATSFAVPNPSVPR